MCRDLKTVMHRREWNWRLLTVLYMRKGTLNNMSKNIRHLLNIYIYIFRLDRLELYIFRIYIVLRALQHFEITFALYLYTNTVLDGSVNLSVCHSVNLSLCLSLCLSVCNRNHFPVVQLQNQAHIWNPRGTGHVFKTIWGAPGAPWKGRQRRPKFFPSFLSPPQAA